MKFLLFEQSAIEILVSTTEFQSTDFSLGLELINHICGFGNSTFINDILVEHTPDGVYFVGKRCEKEFLLIDLVQCDILSEKDSPDNLLLVLQKTFRTSIRIWNHQPFTFSERIHGSKSIIFPFAYTDRRRIVIERAPKCERLEKRGIRHSILAYKYNAEEAPRGEETASTIVLKDAGETYVSLKHTFINKFSALDQSAAVVSLNNTAILHTTTSEQVCSGGFVYLNFDHQISKLTIAQKAVVENPNVTSPIRVDGPAGTGKTASLILRAYTLLNKHKEDKVPFHTIFFAHSESTKYEIEQAFSLMPESKIYTSKSASQSIEFTTLFDFCKKQVNIKESQVIDRDAADAKHHQRMLIEDAYIKVCKEKLRTFKPLLSQELITVLNEEENPKGVILSMLQHEFSVQIKGRTNCTIDEYYQLSQIDNALPVKTKKDKEFIFTIFQEYQRALQTSSVFDTDDITIQALAQWNAPFWRRERLSKGYDYIFVDEMHLFNINEQHSFHYLTKDIGQKQIPICFALDYSQAIGNRGKVDSDFIETGFGNVDTKNYQTVFRSSQEITEFCASISASGALMFQDSYINPYKLAKSGFTQIEEARCQPPKLYMYGDDTAMFNSIKEHIDTFKRELQCNNCEIAVIVFDEDFLSPDHVSKLHERVQKQFHLLKGRNHSSLSREIKSSDPIILSSPENVNGLEFQAVILVGVDEGRVPQTAGVSDISEHYIRYIAFNQLYLAASRAKFRLILLGNTLHGESSCLKYALENGTLQRQIIK